MKLIQDHQWKTAFRSKENSKLVKILWNYGWTYTQISHTYKSTWEPILLMKSFKNTIKMKVCVFIAQILCTQYVINLAHVSSYSGFCEHHRLSHGFVQASHLHHKCFSHLPWGMELLEVVLVLFRYVHFIIFYRF